MNPPLTTTQAPGPISSFIRFVCCGGGVTVLGSWALIVLSGRMDLALANALVTVVTTILATELHGRFSFRSERKGLSTHLQSAGTALMAYLVTTGAMLALDRFDPMAGVVISQAVYLAAASVAGLGRFLLLRLVVFASRTSPATGQAQTEVALAA
ncbi:MAG: GtrA family protein [Streptosporangiaceae bacterium]